MQKKLLKLTTASAAVLHCINKYIDSSVSNNTTKSSGKYYHWKHSDIFYKVSGEGKPVLLIHDLNVFSSENDWTQVMNQLSKHYKVYVPDLPGCGRSEKPSITYTGYLYVQLISDFIRDVIGEKTTVAAEGLSASYTMMADSLDEKLFNKVFMINPPAFSSFKKMPNQRSKTLIRLFELPIIGKTCYYIAVNRSNAENYFSEFCFYNPFHVKQQTVKAGYQAAHFGNGGGKYLLASLKGEYLNADSRQAIKKTNKEVTLIFGEHLPGMKELAEKYSELNENVKIAIIKDTKKLPEVEAPDDIADIINTTMQM